MTPEPADILEFPEALETGPTSDSSDLEGSPSLWGIFAAQDEPEGFLAWAEAFRAEEAPRGAIEVALVELVIVSARRLRKALAAEGSEKVGDAAKLRELAGAKRLWSGSLVDWRRHRAAVASEAAKADARQSSRRDRNSPDAPAPAPAPSPSTPFREEKRPSLPPEKS